VNPLIIVIAAAAVLVVLLVIVVFGRLRHADESERFRHVSDLTSAWSRQQHPEQAKQPGQPLQHGQPLQPLQPAQLAQPEPPTTIDLGAAERGATNSVDSR
jgi:hypothetical protein